MRRGAGGYIAQVSDVDIPGIGSADGCDGAEGHARGSGDEPAAKIEQPAFSVRNELGCEKKVIEAAWPIGDGPVQGEMVQPGTHGRSGGLRRPGKQCGRNRASKETIGEA